MTSIWAGLTAVISLGISATIAWSGGSGSAWVSIGSGRHYLDIVQVGVRAGPEQPGDADYPDEGPHFFAAWGAGEPGDGVYEEVDLGPADARQHIFAVRRSGTSWTLSIDGRVRQRVPAPEWAPRNVRAMAEAHEGVLPRVYISKVRRLVDRTWTADGFGYIAVGIGLQRPAWGRDWMNTR